MRRLYYSFSDRCFVKRETQVSNHCRASCKGATRTSLHDKEITVVGLKLRRTFHGESVPEGT